MRRGIFAVLVIYIWAIGGVMLESYELSQFTLATGIKYNDELNARTKWLQPGSAEARDYCPNPGGVFLRDTSCPARIPTVAKPYCPYPQ